MPRQKLSEYRAKLIIYKALDKTYKGWQIDSHEPLDNQLEELVADANAKYVVKVDQGVKGRFKKGLVLLDVSAHDLTGAVESLISKGYHWLIIEPELQHEQSDERYIAFLSDKSGLTINYSSSGGVDIEENPDNVHSTNISNQANADIEKLASETGINSDQLQRLITTFKDNYFVFMEINPYVLGQAGLQILDAAVEVDDTASFFEDAWQAEDIRSHSEHEPTEEEKIVQDLDANSPASLKLSVLNPNGSVFLLLSGGGASVVVADEAYNQGYGEQLANYGEYSGNPNAEETYVYTKALLSLLIQSSAPKKVLFIGGAVANFTDIAKTFAGVMKAIDEVKDKLAEQSVKVFVRRGGPNQEVGLRKMEGLLENANLLGAVHDPSTPLTVAVTEALQEVRSEQ